MAKPRIIETAEQIRGPFGEGPYRYGFPEGAIVHFTAGHPKQRWEDAGAFCKRMGHNYVVIDHEGTIAQASYLDIWGYHSGESEIPEEYKTIPKQPWTERVDRYTLGIEVLCPGKLDQDLSPNFSRTPYPESRTRTIHHNIDNQEAGPYYCYTAAQERSLTWLLLWLWRNGEGVFDLNLVFGHDEVSPYRKNDPGGSLSMTMPEYRFHLKGLRDGQLITPDPDPEPEPEPEPAKPEPEVLVKLNSIATKHEFFSQQGFWDLIHQANQDHARAVGSSAGTMKTLTAQEAIAVGWAEIGYRNGKTDPRYRHSNGEFGLFPLPSNWSYWARETPDVEEQDMTPAQNTYAFLRYMVGLKNSSEYGRHFLASDPFDDIGRHNTGVMAGVVHGYGYAPNFGATKPEPNGMMEIAGTMMLGPLARQLRRFGFKHQGDVIKSRLENLHRGMAALEKMESDKKN